MPAPMPPQGAGAPPAGPQGGPPPQGGQGGGAAQAVQMVTQGLMLLKKIIDGSGDALGPDEKQQFAGLLNGWQAFVQELSEPQGQEQAPQGGQRPSQPMPANASKGSVPANY